MKTKNYRKPVSLYTRKQLKRGMAGNVPMAFCNAHTAKECKRGLQSRIMMKFNY